MKKYYYSKMVDRMSTSSDRTSNYKQERLLTSPNGEWTASHVTEDKKKNNIITNIKIFCHQSTLVKWVVLNNEVIFSSLDDVVLDNTLEITWVKFTTGLDVVLSKVVSGVTVL